MSKTLFPVIKYFVPTPGAPAVTPNAGGGGTSRTYKIVGLDVDGNHSAASTGTADADGPVTLDGTHYDTVTWTDPAGAASVQIWLTAGAGTAGLLGTVLIGVQTFKVAADNAVAGVPPATNTTGIGPAVDVSEHEDLSVIMSGTFTGTVQLQGSFDGQNWLSEGTAFTTASTTPVAIAPPWAQLRAKMTAYTSGTPDLTVRGHREP